jgi:hypothetical protein
MSEIQVKTTFNQNEINQEIINSDELSFPLSRETMIKQVLDLREQGVRDALIALGWTPPKE